VIKVQMPMLGLTMSEGTIRKWFKGEGDPVAKGEPLFEMETDKATLEVEAPTTGVLLKILAAPDQVVPVGDTVGLIGDPAERTESAPSAPRRGTTISPRARTRA
jgi:pyruvate dehydrogenase E2 component (dihydrolipoamide acetyltransferase)